MVCSEKHPLDGLYTLKPANDSWIIVKKPQDMERMPEQQRLLSSVAGTGGLV